MSDDTKISAGGCFCGAVRYQVDGPLRDIVNCHCRECQSLNGNFGSHSKAAANNIDITQAECLTWFQISSKAQRGFCNRCGSSLFWRSEGQDGMGIIVGSLDDSSGLKTIGHIFVGEKATYYEISDGLPQFPESSDGELSGDTI